MQRAIFVFILLLTSVMAYPRRSSNSFEKFLESYLESYNRPSSETDESSSSEEFNDHVKKEFFDSNNRQERQLLPLCLPASWTCAPGLPACCAGMTCFQGNAKRGPHCVARG